MNRLLLRQSQHLIIWLGILPLVLALIAYRISSEHIASVRATLTTDEFIRRLDELLSTLQDAETGQRGYLLTGESRYLAPFVNAQSMLESRLANIDALAASHNAPQTEITQLHTLVRQKMAELQTTVDLRRRGNLRGALAEVDTDRGERYMLGIRSVIGALRDQQINAFHQRVDQQQRSQFELEAVLVVGILLGFVLLFLAYRFSRLYEQERDLIESEIRTLNNSLELRVKQRTAELEARTRDLEQRSAELQRSNADLTQFAYVASHDLQEPLRMVGSYMGLLSRRYRHELDETAERYIQFAVDGANRMQALIHDLLDYSRAGTQELEKKPISSEQVLQTALNNLALAIKESSAQVRYENLPIVEADEMKLTQVMQNLVSNAVKFRKPDLPPEISITAQRTNGDWMFAVADNGIGFDPKYCDRIFQVFQRLHGIGKYPGNGIGLAICRRIIEHHGGRLWAESEPDAGSTFFFTIPASNDVSDSQPNRRPSTENFPEPVSHV